MRFIRLAATAALGLVALSTFPAQAALPVTGRRATVDGKVIVAVAPCGQHLCGLIE